jgi:hypothetical protein
MEIFSLARLAKGKRIDPARQNAGLPDFNGKLIDIYISPRSMDWTMVFTHENDATERASQLGRCPSDYVRAR